MSIATTLSSVAHAVLILVRPGIWEAIFGGVEAAVSITVCSTPVIIPAVLRALGVGDPFMREDTVDPQCSTGIEIARMTLATVELGLPTSCSTRTADSTKLEGEIGAVVFRQHHSLDSGVKDEHRKHRLVTRIMGGSLGGLEPVNVILPIEESDATDSLCSPVEEKVRDIEADAGGR